MNGQAIAYVRDALRLLDGFIATGPDGEESVSAIQMTGDPESRVQGAINLQAARRLLQSAITSAKGTAA